MNVKHHGTEGMTISNKIFTERGTRKASDEWGESGVGIVTVIIIQVPPSSDNLW